MRFFLVVSADVLDADRVVIGDRSTETEEGIVLDGSGGVRVRWEDIVEVTYEEYGKLRADLIFGNEGAIDRYLRMYADGEIECARFGGFVERGEERLR